MTDLADVTVDLGNDTAQEIEADGDLTDYHKQEQTLETERETLDTPKPSGPIEHIEDSMSQSSTSQAGTAHGSGGTVEGEETDIVVENVRNTSNSEGNDQETIEASDNTLQDPSSSTGGGVAPTATISSYFGSANAEDDPFGSIVAPSHVKSPEEISLSSQNSGDIGKLLVSLLNWGSALS